MDVSNFSNYVKQNGEAITAALFLESDAAKACRVLPNVKGSQNIPLISGDVTLNSGGCSEAVEAGAVSDEIISVAAFNVSELYCPSTIDGKFPTSLLPAGSYSKMLSPEEFAETLTMQRIAEMRKRLEVMIWQGDTVQGALFDGFIKQIDAANKAIDGNLKNLTTIDIDNIIQAVDDMILSLPTEVRVSGDCEVVLGADLFDLYTMALRNANYYHYTADSVDGVLMSPALSVPVKRQYGLTGTKRMFAGRSSSFWIATDIEDEYANSYEWEWSASKGQAVFRSKGKLGAKPVVINQISQFTLEA